MDLSSAEEDDISSDEAQPESKPEPVPLADHQQSKQPAHVESISSDGRSIPFAASAGFAAAILGAGIALTRHLRLRSQRRRDAQPKDEDNMQQLSYKQHPRSVKQPLRRRRRIPKNTGVAHSLPIRQADGSAPVPPKATDKSNTSADVTANHILPLRNGLKVSRTPADKTPSDVTAAMSGLRRPSSTAKQPRLSAAEARPANASDAASSAASAKLQPGLISTAASATHAADKASIRHQGDQLATIHHVPRSKPQTSADNVTHIAAQQSAENDMSAGQSPLLESSARQTKPTAEARADNAPTLEQIMAQVAAMTQSGGPQHTVAPHQVAFGDSKASARAAVGQTSGKQTKAVSGSAAAIGPDTTSEPIPFQSQLHPQQQNTRRGPNPAMLNPEPKSEPERQHKGHTAKHSAEATLSSSNTLPGPSLQFKIEAAAESLVSDLNESHSQPSHPQDCSSQSFPRSASPAEEGRPSVVTPADATADDSLASVVQQDANNAPQSLHLNQLQIPSDNVPSSVPTQLDSGHESEAGHERHVVPQHANAATAASDVDNSADNSPDTDSHPEVEFKEDSKPTDSSKGAELTSDSRPAENSKPTELQPEESQGDSCPPEDGMMPDSSLDDTPQTGSHPMENSEPTKLQHAESHNASAHSIDSEPTGNGHRAEPQLDSNAADAIKSTEVPDAEAQSKRHSAVKSNSIGNSQDTEPDSASSLSSDSRTIVRQQSSASIAAEPDSASPQSDITETKPDKPAAPQTTEPQPDSNQPEGNKPQPNLPISVTSCTVLPQSDCEFTDDSKPTAGQPTDPRFDHRSSQVSEATASEHAETVSESPAQVDSKPTERQQQSTSAEAAVSDSDMSRTDSRQLQDSKPTTASGAAFQSDNRQSDESKPAAMQQADPRVDGIPLEDSNGTERQQSSKSASAGAATQADSLSTKDSKGTERQQPNTSVATAASNSAISQSGSLSAQDSKSSDGQQPSTSNAIAVSETTLPPSDRVQPAPLPAPDAAQQGLRQSGQVPASSASNGTSQTKRASLPMSQVAASSKLNPAAKEFCPGAGIASVASASAPITSWAKVAAAAPSAGPSKPPGNLRPSSAKSSSRQSQQVSKGQPQPAGKPNARNSSRRGFNSGGSSPQRQPQQQQRQNQQQQEAQYQQQTRQPDQSASTSMKAGSRQQSDSSVSQAHSAPSGMGDQARSEASATPGARLSPTVSNAESDAVLGTAASLQPQGSFHAGATTPSKRWADLLVADEEAAAAKEATDTAKTAATAAAQPTDSMPVSPGAVSVRSLAAESSDDDGWTQVASRSQRDKRRGSRGVTPTHDDQAQGLAASSPPPPRRTASSSGLWGHAQQLPTTSWHDAPPFRPSRSGSSRGPKPSQPLQQSRTQQQQQQTCEDNQQATRDGRSTDQPQQAAPDAASKSASAQAAGNGTGTLHRSNPGPGATTAEKQLRDASSDLEAASVSSGAERSGAPKSVSQSASTADEAPSMSPAASSAAGQAQEATVSPKEPSSPLADASPTQQVADVPSDGLNAATAPGKLDSSGSTMAAADGATAGSEPDTSLAAVQDDDDRAASQGDIPLTQLHGNDASDDLGSGEGGIAEATEDPDMPGTPDQSVSATPQVPASVSAVGEEDYSTPAVSDAGGSENMTTTSSRSTNVVDPLGIMVGAPTAEEHAKAVKQAKKLIAAGLHAYTQNGNVDGAEKMVATAVRVLRDAGVVGEPLAEAEAALGDIYHGTGRVDDALDHLTLAHQVAEDADSSGTPVRTELSVKLANNLATLLLHASQTQKAAELAQRFSESMAARHGPDSRWTTHSRIQAAAALEAAGDKEGAIEGLQSAADQLLAHAAEVESEGNGAVKERSTTAENNATAEQATANATEDGDLEMPNLDAIPAELQGQEEDDPVVGARHAAARLLVALGEHLVRCKRSADAERAFRAANDAAVAAWGPDAPHTFFVRSQLASFLRTRSDAAAKAEAVELHEGLLAMTEAHRGQDYQTSVALETMARVYLEAARPADAVAAAQRSVDLAVALLPHKKHPLLEKHYACLATAKEAAGDAAGAREAQKLAMGIHMHAHGHAHTHAHGHHRGSATQRPHVQRPPRRR